MSDCVGNKYLINNSVYPASGFDDDLLQSGQMVYEVIRVEEGIPLFIEDYLNRLKTTIILSGLKINFDPVNILKLIQRLIDINDFRQGPVKLMISIDKTVVYLMKPYLPEPLEYLSGVKTVFIQIERANPNAKVWNPSFRETIINALKQHSAFEAILVNRDGEITEGSRSNVFFVKGDELYTAPSAAVLPGITRMKVLEVCNSEDIKVNEVNLPLSGIGNYDSVFITGTSRKVLPVRQIDDQIFSVDNELVRNISIKFEELTSEYIRQWKNIQGEV
jgi:branched-chain amino acid aminotransferase